MLDHKENKMFVAVAKGLVLSGIALFALFALFAPPASADLLDEVPVEPKPVGGDKDTKSDSNADTTVNSSKNSGNAKKAKKSKSPFRANFPIRKPGSKSPSKKGNKAAKKPASSTGSSKVTPAAKPSVPKPKTSRSVLAPTKKKKVKKDAGKQPVHFESNGARGIRDKGKFELIDNVVVTQGTMRMEADKATVFADQKTNDVKTVHATGKVKLFQEDEETGERLKAFGDKMVFDNVKRTVILSGNARLWRGPSLIRGKKITYELDTGWIYADKIVGEMRSGEEAQKDAESKKKSKSTEKEK